SFNADRLVAEARLKLSKKAIEEAVETDLESAKALAKAMATADAEARPPIRKRYLLNDSTVEKTGEILNQNPNGIAVFRDELIGFLKSLEKDGQEGARAFYLEAWNGSNRFTYDRIGRGTVDIESTTISLIGGIQPSPLREYLREAVKGGRGDDGLMQRFQLA